MTVTVYTDASIKGGRGAWAGLVLTDAAPVEFSGRLRGTFRSSAATEICAIANTVQKARVAGLINAGDDVAIWCDNMAAVLWANGLCREKRGGDPMLINARRFLRDDARRKRYRFTAWHIKGHQRLDSDDPGAIYNIRCDELCAAERDLVEAKPWEALVERVARARRLAERRAA